MNQLFRIRSWNGEILLRTHSESHPGDRCFCHLRDQVGVERRLPYRLRWLMGGNRYWWDVSWVWVTVTETAPKDTRLHPAGCFLLSSVCLPHQLPPSPVTSVSPSLSPSPPLKLKNTPPLWSFPASAYNPRVATNTYTCIRSTSVYLRHGLNPARPAEPKLRVGRCGRCGAVRLDPGRGTLVPLGAAAGLTVRGCMNEVTLRGCLSDTAELHRFKMAMIHCSYITCYPSSPHCDKSTLSLADPFTRYL